MRGQVNCELGRRVDYVPTAFHIPLNGDAGSWEAPCADGIVAFGRPGVCGKAPLPYDTVVMQDIKEGVYQDLFVSEASAALLGAENHLLSLNDVDESGYYYDGLFRNHYGAVRSEAALALILDRIWE